MAKKKTAKPAHHPKPKKPDGKIALAMICKGTADEAARLHVCLTYARPHVDAIYVVFTAAEGEQIHEDCYKVAATHKAETREFLWVDDFAAARNFAFQQVPPEYDYILWLDADDALRNGAVMRDIVLREQKDAYSMWYQYAFDEQKRPNVVHQNVRVVKNDGTFVWKGALHESITSTRGVDPFLLSGADVLHMSDAKHFEMNRERNLRIALKQKEINPDDPRSYFNTGNAYVGNSKFVEALKEFQTFKEKTQSHEEKYIAHLRCAEAYWGLGKKFDAIHELRYAIGMKPTYPDAYVRMGMFLTHMGLYKEAIEYLGLSLAQKPPYFSIVVFNPREYDFEPIRLLAVCHYELNEMESALQYFELCLRIYPKDEKLLSFVAELRATVERNEKMKALAAELAKLPLNRLKGRLGMLKPEERSHPAICHLANSRIFRTESSGKDIAIFCGYTSHEWSPEIMAKKGVGGSEEAVIHLAKRWKDKGWNVSVYNSCGFREQVFDGVSYKPFWMWNYRDRQDVVILWRHPMMAQYPINADKVFVDMHDVLPADEFTEERLQRINLVMVKTIAHAQCFPKIPKEKIMILPNGIEPWTPHTEKQKNLIINTSSPDRSLSTLLDIFAQVKKRVPEAEMHWAYGWEGFDSVNKERKDRMEWKENMQKRMKELGVVERGRLNRTDIERLYDQAAIFLYPTEFYEIFCISAVKAQIAGAFPITTDFAALNEVVKWGDTIHSKKTLDTWVSPYQFDFAATDLLEPFVEKVIERLRNPARLEEKMRESTITKFSWDRVADEWCKLFV